MPDEEYERPALIFFFFLWRRRGGREQVGGTLGAKHGAEGPRRRRHFIQSLSPRRVSTPGPNLRGTPCQLVSIAALFFSGRVIL